MKLSRMALLATLAVALPAAAHHGRIGLFSDENNPQERSRTFLTAARTSERFIPAIRACFRVRDEIVEFTHRRRGDSFQNHDIVVPHDDEPFSGFKPQPRPDVFGNDDLTLV